jgi:ribose transport system ATP-binding protein
MISKALVREASLIAMDEPTAALSGPESEQLFSIIRDLAASGVAILYVSHRLDEVLDLCDRITVFRDGQVAERATRGRLDKKGLIRAIVGHDVKGADGRRRISADKSGIPLFSVRDVARGVAVKGVSFDVYRGEILGLGGLVGSGRTEVARLAFGVDRLQRGHFEMSGKRLTIGSEHQAIELGIALVPEERRSQGLMLAQSVAFNINIAPRRGHSALRLVREDAKAGRPPDQGPWRQNSQQFDQDREPLRRQPAKGADRPMAAS